MVEAITVFCGEAEKKKYVMSCEAEYEAALDRAVARAISDSDCRILTLSGPTCSGKTTTARKLISEFSEAGRRVHVVSIDDFYYDRAVLIERASATGGRIDFDSPSTIDMDAFSEVVEAVLAGHTVKMPRFDFRLGRRSGYEEITPSEGDVYIFEGIQAVYPEVTATLSGERYLSVMAYACRGLRPFGEEIDRTELRLLRRLVRDYNFRGASPLFTLELWQGVRENEEAHILPYLDSVDVVIDSTLGYELSALKPYLMPLLTAIPAEHDFRPEAERLLSILSRMDEIKKAYIPATSVYREFLG